MIDGVLNMLDSNTATVIAGVLGFLGGVFSRFAKYWFEKRTRKKKLRTAILTEIKSPKNAIDELNEISINDEFNFEHTIIPTQIFESHKNDIGLLANDEVAHVVNYYSIAEVAEDQIEALSEDDREVDHESFLNDTIAGLKDARDDAEDVIKAHEKTLGGYRYKIKSVICG